MSVEACCAVTVAGDRIAAVRANTVPEMAIKRTITTLPSSAQFSDSQQSRSCDLAYLDAPYPSLPNRSWRAIMTNPQQREGFPQRPFGIVSVTAHAAAPAGAAAI